ncbi:MAG: hypothetical protein ACK5PZ_18450 [Pirellula sp.]|jgi:hypothetical protein
MMRKTALVTTAFVLTLTGCNACNSMRQSVTGLFRGCGRANNVGAPCDAGCEMGAAAPCDPCAQSSAHYGGYDDAIVGTTYEGGISGSYAGTVDGVTIGSPAGSTISTIPSGSYIGSPTPAAAPRTEMVRPKPAN